MSTKIYIFGDQGIWRREMTYGTRSELEADLNGFLGDSGRVIYDDEDEHYGLWWSVDVLIYSDRNINLWVFALADFLRKWGVPDGPLTFSMFRRDKTVGIQHRRIVVP